MKQAVIMGPGNITWREEKIPSLQPSHVLIKTAAVGICTLEQRSFRGEGSYYPFLGGHEISGIIVAVSPDCPSSLQPGMRVVVSRLKRCGVCRNCRSGLDNICENEDPPVPGEPWGPGGFSEYLLVRDYEVYPLDRDTDLYTACLTEPLACVLRSIASARLRPGASVLVIGTGIMGVLHILLARLQGAQVIASETNAGRRLQVPTFGAEHVINPAAENLRERVGTITAGKGVAAVFFTSGGVEALSEGTAVLADGGTLVVYGSTARDEKLCLDPRELHYREIHLTGVTRHTRSSFQQAVSLLPLLHKQLEPLVGRRWEFSRVQEAFEHAGDSRFYRDLVVMEER